MNFSCSGARVGEYGRAVALSPDDPRSSQGGGAALHETRKRVTWRLLEAVLKWLGVALLLVACAMLVYLAAVLFARGAGWILVP